jgi:hypothetical protein
MDAPIIASVQQAPDVLVQHVVVPVMAMPAWAPNAYYQVPHATYKAAEFCDQVWPAPVFGFGDYWKRGYHHGRCPSQSDGSSTKASSRPSSVHGRDGCESESSASLTQSPTPRRGQSIDFSCRASADQPFDSGSYVSVVLGNLPKTLCTEKFFEAALEQARLEREILAFEVKLSDNTGGEAVVVLPSECAAQRLIRHFQGLKWFKMQGPITTRYCGAAGRSLMERRRSEQQQQQPQSESIRPQANKEVLKLQKTLREIRSLKQRPVADLDTLQLRKMQRESSVIERLRELGVKPAGEDDSIEVVLHTPRAGANCTEMTAAEKSYESSHLKEASSNKSIAKSHVVVVGSPTKKLWADYDSDDELEGDLQSSNAPPHPGCAENLLMSPTTCD